MNFMCACTLLVSDETGRLLVGTFRPFTLLVNPKDYVIKQLWFYLLSDNYLITFVAFNPLKAELNPICNLLALLGAHHIFHFSGLRINRLL